MKRQREQNQEVIVIIPPAQTKEQNILQDLLDNGFGELTLPIITNDVQTFVTIIERLSPSLKKKI